MVEALTETGHDGEDPAGLFGVIGSLRIPLEYLAELFTAGDPAPVEAALCRVRRDACAHAAGQSR